MQFYTRRILKKDIRVRFAPSPTGPLHIGGVRTALFNYLFAKKHHGQFVLRIEDTDQERFVEGAEEYIREALEWCGIHADESPWSGGDYGPYRQSERSNYRKYAMSLIEQGHAYYAFDTAQEIEEMRERLRRARVISPQYNAVSRMSMKNSLTLPADKVKELLESNTPHVVRLKVPRKEDIRLYDEVRAWIVVKSLNLDDKVLLKSDGLPTYHLANVVDDHNMKISHVIRGEEWLPSAPIHVLLYRYLGWEDEIPAFVHLPLIIRADGNGKLSKRDGDKYGFSVYPIEWTDPKTGQTIKGYREDHYLPEALVNFLAFLGWNPGTQKEKFSMQELIEAFSLERIGKAGTKFDIDKAKWFNQSYLRDQEPEYFVSYLQEHIQKYAQKYARNSRYSHEQLLRITELLKDRLVFISDLVKRIEVLF